MAQTIPDIEINQAGWQDLLITTGIPDGTPIIIINKGDNPLLLQESDTQPSDDNFDGNPLTTTNQNYGAIQTDDTTIKLWVRSMRGSAIIYPSKVTVARV